MNTFVQPVRIKNKNGLFLHGILHSPNTPKKTIGIILLSPGVKSRVAPHRLYLKMAIRFVELGFFVLRFDPEGLGDSEGQINEKFSADVYGSIQLGRFIDDTKASITWMGKRCSISKFIIGGLCGGAITGLLSGAKDKRVVGLLSLGIPVILDSSTIDQSKYITKGQLEELKDSYLKKIFNLHSWLRFLSFQSDYLLILKSLLVKFKNQKKVGGPSVYEQKPLKIKSIRKNNFNPYFPIAFNQMLNERKKILLIFSESDRLYWEFEEKFLNKYTNDISKYDEQFEIHVSKDANHIFSFQEWQTDMLDKTCTWLRRFM